MSWRVIGGSLLILIGVVGLALPFLSWGLSRDSGVLIGVSAYGDAHASSSAKAETVITDRLRIERLGIDMPLLGGASSEYGLSKGAWLWPDGVEPGEKGNAIVFGHRWRYLPPLSNTLFKLDKIQEGDIVIVLWQGKEFRYTVTSKRITAPEDLSVLSPTTDTMLTLVTCNPIWSTKERLIVTAVPVE